MYGLSDDCIHMRSPPDSMRNFYYGANEDKGWQERPYCGLVALLIDNNIQKVGHTNFLPRYISSLSQSASEAVLAEAKLEIKAIAEEIKHTAKMIDEAEASGIMIGFQRWVKAAEQLRNKEIRLLDKEIRLLDERAWEHARLESAGVSLFSCSILTIWQMPESPHRRMALLFLPCFHLEEESSSALRIAHQLRRHQG
jgi:hypothetical protein